MRPLAFSINEEIKPIPRDMEHKQALLEIDQVFFAERGIDLSHYMSGIDDQTRTNYEKSTTTPKGHPNPTDSGLDHHTSLDHPDKE